ncbi:MAG: winged helix-turn-helix domain-containing protein, partial [Ilumatobacter sp.]
RARLRSTDQSRSDVIAVGSLSIDLAGHTAMVDGRSIDLSSREFALLEVLARHAGRVLSQTQLLDQVWGYDFDGSSNVVEVYVSHLRGKIGAERIKTVRGAGYKLHDT